MKPVPILQYLDHFGRVGQAETQPVAPPPPAPAPFRPRALHLAPEAAPRPAPAVVRALREMTLTNAEAPPAPRRRQPTEAEIEARIAEAYERGRADGAEAARIEDAETFEREIAGERERATVAQLDFELNEYAKLADVVSSGLQEIEQRIAEAVARIVGPLISRAAADKVIDGLCDDLARLRVGGGGPAMIKIRGPERVLAKLRERVAYLSVEVEFVAEHGVEVTIEAGETTIQSQLQPWADLIASSAR